MHQWPLSLVLSVGIGQGKAPAGDQMAGERRGQGFYPTVCLPSGSSGVHSNCRRLQLPSGNYPHTATLSEFQKFRPHLVPSGLGCTIAP